MVRIVVVSAVALALSSAVANAGRIPVTSCGTVVEGVGELTGDLDCSGYAGSAVILKGRSRLLLKGFTLTANASAPDSDFAGVECAPKYETPLPRWKPCAINGPGAIVGGTFGVEGGQRITIRNVTISGTVSHTVQGSFIRLIDSTVIATGNAPKYVSFMAAGVLGLDVYLRGTSVTGGTFQGVWSNGGRLRLVNSTVQNNGQGCGPEPNYCADLVSYVTPRVGTGSACGTSKRVNHTTFGVCAND